MNITEKSDKIKVLVLLLTASLTVMSCTMSNGSDFGSPPTDKASPVEEAAVDYIGEDQEVANSEIEKVKQSHEQRLLAIDGVTGVGIGQDPQGNQVITVYVLNAEVQKKVPQELDGFMVQTEITGEIKAF
ncbi:MAG: hypothetical protein F6K50_28120 [Moorea sp. SIO3I7]|uniref:hypothetical protein n=1 Tax=unclassified Moorena TaxID=2683338 RepID=UPI0013C0CFAB|nr:MULTISPECIES: hypothetical protein [unclassified Moorena]NEN99207.1 hypothetical protein [Moorena sp. SIO3I7]NEO08800.1 hypothetical protein [Moorena sp. SIO3I8]NEO21784.1 hypothetical protein [Moorena sp. SIO4A5]NEP22929.1 hypothetical protein [Moorena sp. SIO3I6]NEQ58618.1 hypothetical protein [Moorena sp. SIO4A1]